ncbi:MAG: rRNA maturation RNase YbeY, partial [Candidatus Cloacimonadota bacterium]
GIYGDVQSIENCIFTSNTFIQELNKQYGNQNVPTDVLAFSFTEGQDSEYRKEMFGDIYISVEMARENAERYDVSLHKEIRLLFIHGLLHLLGYDDEDDDNKEIMRAKEHHYLKNK